MATDPDRPPTSFLESNALLAIIQDDPAAAREAVAALLPGERARLAWQAVRLAELCQQYALELAAATGPCGLLRECQETSVGYFYSWSQPRTPRGVCATHRSEAERGYTVHEIPKGPS